MLDSTLLILALTACGGCYVAMLRLYLWTVKVVEEVKTMINDHRLETDKHVDVSELVRSGDCDGRFRLLTMKIETVTAGVTEAREGIRETQRAMTKVQDALDEGLERIIEAVVKGRSGENPR